MHDHNHDHGPDDAAPAAPCWHEGGPLFTEITSHLPFSVLSVIGGLVMAGLVCYLVPAETLAAVTGGDGHDHAGHDHAGDIHSNGFLPLFHLFHPAHMLFSGAATAAMFMRYERAWLKAIIVGFSGAVLVCGVSDILMPHCAAVIMGKSIEMHICIIQEPMLVLPFAGVGVLLGISAAAAGTVSSTLFSHTMHVIASTMASIFYLIGAFGRFEWMNEVGMVFLFICLAVMIPCCLSDVVYPLLFTKKAKDEFAKSGHPHQH